ncbi:hypothetical protein [Alysiella filiformis]|uniref:Adhesin n=1 Tax=Alysiella filiformis DSM 16848 TaxID=1120981 RepID=A0A286EWH8_9NEIS|nr:hypothetical protein [Alysiella filiformis]QMT32150.1 hypothetical protein H3L97_04665 [Alysiella filiformis]UBQ56931.1 hypothetical protein JF568_04010 [Alysiella filiformis DSM 16848]SOD75288.1 hypothetical protein SAMN02746062_02337 [Alysiella filiformis DSM 16848]
MKFLKLGLIATLASMAIHAQAAGKNELDSTIQAAYQCKAQGVKSSIPLNVMYGLKNGKVVVAQAKMSNGTLSKGLWANATQNNVFTSREADGTIWTTTPHNHNNIHRVDGGILSVRQNGKNAIVLENCKLDPKATAQLNG